MSIGRVSYPLIAIVVLLTGCGSSSRDSADSQASADVAVAFELAQARVNATVGASGSAALRRVSAAEAAVSTECLKEHGVDYTVPVPDDAPVRYEIPEGSELWVWGADDFGLTTALDEDDGVRREFLERNSDQGQGSPPPPAGFQDAYFGPEEEFVSLETPAGDVVDIFTGGCAGQAMEEVYGRPVEEVERTRLRLLPLLDLHGHLLRTPAVRGAAEEWAACMEAAGFSLSAPDDVTRPLGEGLTPVLLDGEETAELAALEHRLATSHVSCLESTGATETYMQEFTRFSETKLTELEREVEAWQGIQAQARDRSTAILDGDTTGVDR